MRAPAAILLLLLASPAPAARPGVVQYVYIEANEGGSSGGHAAIRFGAQTYHFQHERGALLRLRPDGWDHFTYQYGVLGNRTMHLSALDASAADRLRTAFSERYLTERALFDHRAALRDDGVLLELLLADRQGTPAGTLDLRGAGLFFPEDPDPHPSDAVLAVRRQVLQRYGADGIRRRMDALRNELAHLSLPSPDSVSADIPRDGYPRWAEPFSRRHRDLASALAALRALDHALPLRPEAQWPTTDVILDAIEQRALATFAARLTDDLTRLVGSDRPDWGFAFLVGMARLAAVRESIATGRLVLLDAFPSDAEVIPGPSVRRHRDGVDALRDDARRDLGRARVRLHEPDAIAETDYAALEAAGNRLLELDATIRSGGDLRVASEERPPSRPGPWSDVVVPEVPTAELRRGLQQARVVERAFAARLEERYGYNLITRNCVSEIFQTAHLAGVELAGHVATPWSLDFIPFVASRSVDHASGGGEATTVPSYRRACLEALYRHQRGLSTWMKECNVVTSTIYRPNADDSVFLFFTDDLVPTRPLFGAVNLVAGIGVAAAGVPALPFDGGHLLLAGLRGVLFSLPEVAFVNLRKGSFDHLPAEDRPVDAGSTAGSSRPCDG